MADQKITTEDYLKKPYTRIITPDEEGGFTGEILEFPGCLAEGETPNETFEALQRAAASWIEAAQDQGQEIPEPVDNQGYGGKIALRLPRSIHRQAAKMAERDKTSLNQFLLSSIAARVGAETFCEKLIERSKKEIGLIFNVTANLNLYTSVSGRAVIDPNFLAGVKFGAVPSSPPLTPKEDDATENNHV
jgi:predicted RNase H-like HicB family nuclease